MLKYAPPSTVDGLDAWDRSLEVARSTGLRNRLEQSAPLLGSWPRADYDLIWAFSVFTHLDRQAFEHNLQALLAALKPDGTAVVTVRPPEYWLHPEINDPDAHRSTLADGFTFRTDGAFVEHYGNTAVTLDYLRAIPGARLVDIEWSPYDALQLYAAFRPAT
jgi:SAM-dependent methyltransferase